VQAILFDLDGTLLDIDLNAFLRRYFNALGAAADALFPGQGVVPAVLESTGAMQQPHPGVTNRQAFNADFLQRTGIDLDDHWDVFERFYAEEFPLLGESSGPAKGAHRAVAVAKDLGLSIVVATQPIFPHSAIEARIAWAGLADAGLDTLTTYEVMHACKPMPTFFVEAAAMAGAKPSDCIMVGDDRRLDLPAADVGMRTFYVGPDSSSSADWSGDLDDLADLLPRLLDADRR
jgi:FMN phosphatase YigB (HAD superfamily)